MDKFSWVLSGVLFGTLVLTLWQWKKTINMWGETIVDFKKCNDGWYKTCTELNERWSEICSQVMKGEVPKVKK